MYPWSRAVSAPAMPGPAAETFEVRHERPQDLVEPQHRDGEVGALQAQARVADDQREEDGGTAAHGRGREPGPAGLRYQNRPGIGAGAEERHVAERDVA